MPQIAHVSLSNYLLLGEHWLRVSEKIRIRGSLPHPLAITKHVSPSQSTLQRHSGNSQFRFLARTSGANQRPPPRGTTRPTCVVFRGGEGATHSKPAISRPKTLYTRLPSLETGDVGAVTRGPQGASFFMPWKALAVLTQSGNICLES